MNIDLKLEKEFYTIKDIKDMLQFSRLTIYRYIDQGKIKTYKFGKEYRIRKEDFENFLEKHKN